MTQIRFELDGVTFVGKYLDPEKSLDGFALLAPLLGGLADGVAAEAVKDPAGVAAGVIKGALAGFKDLPKFAPLFKAAYSVVVPDPKSGTQREIALDVVYAQTFRGRPALLVGWLVAAIHAEYEGFLASSGRNILEGLGARFGFQITLPSIGQSGGSSSPTNAE